MLFLRITPTLPNLFINLASPIVDVPFHVFFLATLIGLVPAAYITVRVSSFACLLHHLSIYDMHSAFLCFISFRHLHKVRRRVLKFSFFFIAGWPCYWRSQISERSVWFQDIVSTFPHRVYLYSSNDTEKKEDCRIAKKKHLTIQRLNLQCYTEDKNTLSLLEDTTEPKFWFVYLSHVVTIRW